jgi:RHS repeat-associated protein
MRKELDQGNDSVLDEVISYLYDANDRLVSEALDTGDDGTVDQTTVYEYGAANDRTEQTKKTVWDGNNTDPNTGTKLSETTYTYNVRGRLEQVEIDSDGVGGVDRTHTYEYNDSGIRVSQTVDNGTTVEKTVYHVDPNNHTGYAQVLEEGIDDNVDGQLQVGEIDTTYTLGHDVIAQQSPNEGNGETLYFLYDGHGSTRALINAALELAEKFAYDAYGNMLPGAGLTAEPASALTSLLYSGEQVDATTGLGYNRARFVQFGTGRFLTLDPFAGNVNDPLSLHKYLYTHGNPITGIDPTGMFEGLVGALASMSIGSVVSSIANEVAAPLFDNFATQLLPAGFLENILPDARPSVVRFGVTANASLSGKIPLLRGTFGAEILMNARGRGALFGFAGLSLASGRAQTSVIGQAGVIFNLDESTRYNGLRVRLSVGLDRLPISVRGTIKNALLKGALLAKEALGALQAGAASLPLPLPVGGSGQAGINWVKEMGRANAQLAVAINQLVNNASVVVDFPLGNPNGPVGISLGLNAFPIATASETRIFGNAGTSLSLALFGQLYPSRSVFF